MTGHVKDVFDALERMTPFVTKPIKSRFEAFCEWVSICLLGLSGLTFVCLCAFAIYTRFAQPLSEIWRLVALATAVLTQLLAVLAIVAQSVPGLAIPLFFRKHAFRRLKGEFDHDAANARVLARFKRGALLKAEQYLSTIIERRKLFMGALIGNPEAVAVLSLGTMAWSAYKELAQKLDTPVAVALHFGVAFLAGLAVGAMLLNRVLRRYAYHRDLLKLALTTQQEESGAML
jgi:hypothetical protein